MIDPEEMQLAIAYSDLPQNIAWLDFMRFQVAECERLELAAMNATGTPYQRLEAIVAWQQRRIVVRTMQDTVRDSAETLRSNEMENIDERTDRASRANW